MGTLKKQDLLDDLLRGEVHILSEALSALVSSSRRFAAFVSDCLPKVRKKLRAAQDPESARDLLLELHVAYLVSKDKRFSLVYEPTPAGSGRGPDFEVRFTSRLTFMVEVTRLRGDAVGLDARRLASVLAAKVRQTVRERSNVVLIGTEGEPPSDERLADLMKEIRQQAETVDEDALLRQGFRHRGEYLRRLERTSCLVAYRAPPVDASSAHDPSEASVASDAVGRVSTWVNAEARVPLPSDVRRALLACLRAS